MYNNSHFIDKTSETHIGAWTSTHPPTFGRLHREAALRFAITPTGAGKRRRRAERVGAPMDIERNWFI